MTAAFLAGLLGAGSLAGPSAVQAQAATTPPPVSQGEFGILVMAHGGDSTWNRTVDQAIAPLRRSHPIVVAFGMANPETLSSGLDSLRRLGVQRIAVVRLFISGRSFLPETRYLLGLSPERPSVVAAATTASHPGNAPPAATGHAAVPLIPIDHQLVVATEESGLMDSPVAEIIVQTRARMAGRNPGTESVLLLAHGMGHEEENRQLLEAMSRAAVLVRSDGFHTVRTATLREDWSGPRALAEAEIRAFVAAETSAGRQVLVVPYRLSGLGPYAKVLEGLEYLATDGFLPHDGVTEWILETARTIACRARWAGTGDCGMVR
ncbi:MAG: hypothetical protein AABZ01_12845 [Gemmatimonadota bacterium]